MDYKKWEKVIGCFAGAGGMSCRSQEEEEDGSL
jgi:hypothetical protein